MSDVSSFYDTLDLKYPEIGVAMQIIDRMNPGNVKFAIPVLTPDMDTSKLSEQTIYQDKTNLNNEEQTLEVENITVTNYIVIPMPREVCALPGGQYSMSLSGSANRLSGTGGVSPSSATGPGSINVSGGQAAVTGSITLTPVDRYIPMGSKWIIMFIGGDVTKPRVVARYAEETT